MGRFESQARKTTALAAETTIGETIAKSNAEFPIGYDDNGLIGFYHVR